MTDNTIPIAVSFTIQIAILLIVSPSYSCLLPLPIQVPRWNISAEKCINFAGMETKYDTL